jgi:hypothetical protein
MLVNLNGSIENSNNMERRAINNNLETKYELMQKDIKHINSNIGEIKEYIKEDREWKKEFGSGCELKRKELDGKYAGKYIETIAITAFGGLCVGIILMLLGKG